jgi:parvulin-like peptidyl-prolyl isomerase
LKLNKLKALAIILIIAVAFIFTACGEQAGQERGAAVVNGEIIEFNVLEHRFGSVIQGFPVTGEEEINEIREWLLDELIREALIRQAAIASGITVEASEIDAEINEIKEAWGEDVFRAILAENSLTEDDIRGMSEQSILEDRLAALVTEGITVEDFMLAQVSHILLETREDAQSIIVRLNAGENFGELARQYSICPSGERDAGRMANYFAENGVFTDGFNSFDPDFAKGAHELLAVGDFSQEPVATRFGYHIILLESKIPAVGEYKEILEGLVLHHRRVTAFEEYYARLYEEANIVNYLRRE